MGIISVSQLSFFSLFFFDGVWLSLIDWNTEYYYVWTDATCEFKEWWICRSRGFIWHALKYCWADNGIRNPRCHPTSEGSRILQLKISATMSDVALKKFCWCYKKKKQGLGGKIHNNNHIRIWVLYVSKVSGDCCCFSLHVFICFLLSLTENHHLDYFHCLLQISLYTVTE